MSSEVEKMAERILGAARDDWCEITQEQRNYEVHVLSDSLQAAIDERIDNHRYAKESILGVSKRNHQMGQLIDEIIDGEVERDKNIRQLEQRVKALDNRVSRLVQFISKDLDMPDGVVIDI